MVLLQISGDKGSRISRCRALIHSNSARFNTGSPSARIDRALYGVFRLNPRTFSPLNPVKIANSFGDDSKI